MASAYPPVSSSPLMEPAHRRTLPRSQLPFPNPAISRRLAFGVGLPLLLCPQMGCSAPALAKDIPIFGIRKRVEKLEQQVVKEVEELVKEGEEEVTQLVKEGERETLGTVAGIIKSFGQPGSSSSSSTTEGTPPAFQAGAVLVTEMAAVIVTTSVVNGLLSQP